MFDCEVCGRGLRARELLDGLLRRHDASYPFRTIQGSRHEHPVRYLCHRCRSRARRGRTGPREPLPTVDAATRARYEEGIRNRGQRIRRRQRTQALLWSIPVVILVGILTYALFSIATR